MSGHVGVFSHFTTPGRLLVGEALLTYGEEVVGEDDDDACDPAHREAAVVAIGETLPVPHRRRTCIARVLWCSQLGEVHSGSRPPSCTVEKPDLHP